MAGYEDLTADQLVMIAQLVTFAIVFLASSHIVTSLIHWRTAKIIQFRMQEEVSKSIAVELNKDKVPLVQRIVEWFKSRRKKPVDPFDKYRVKPIEEVT